MWWLLTDCFAVSVQTIDMLARISAVLCSAPLFWSSWSHKTTALVTKTASYNNTKWQKRTSFYGVNCCSYRNRLFSQHLESKEMPEERMGVTACLLYKRRYKATARGEVPIWGLLKKELSHKVAVLLPLLCNQPNREDHTTETGSSSAASSQMESVFRASFWATLLMKGLQP